jgi:hypothetical protein
VPAASTAGDSESALWHGHRNPPDKLADAIERAGTTDPEPLRDALAATSHLSEFKGTPLPRLRRP